MKAIINGKRYDTDKAIKVATASSNEAPTSYSWWIEVLYKTPRSGAYFLAGEGNARSHYATNLGAGSWGPGEKITPMTRDEAFAWAQDRLKKDPDAIEIEFGDLVQDA